jgi:D-alanyl-D-alanine carboxypeptidase
MDALMRGLGDAVRAELDRAGIPGCSLALVNVHGPLWAGGFGHTDAARSRPAEADTVYRLFSGTKLFTATAVLQLEERGLLALSDPVERHVPEAEGARGITLLQLLSHQSGLKETLRGLLAVSFPPAEPPTAAQALAGYRLVPARPAGTRVEYRNVNYALLGEVIHRVAGVGYREYVLRDVLAPLGMTASFGLTAETRGRAATGTIGRADPMRLVLRFLFPGVGARLYGARVGRLVELREYDLATSAIGGLVGTMPDFGRFLTSQLAGGGPLLRHDTTVRMQTQVAAGAAGIESRVGTALGWKVGAVGGRRFLNHEGGGAGFTSELRLYPEAGLGMALGMNAMRMPVTMRLAHRICEVAREVAGESS